MMEPIMRFIQLAVLSVLAMPALAAVPSTPAAKVEAHGVVHRDEGVAIRLPATAKHLGSERFILYGVADAEVHVFVEEAAPKTIAKVYWVQFESYLPDKPDLSYNYVEGNRPVELNGVRTWLRSNPVPTNGPMRAGSDREHVFNILTRAGYVIPPAVMNVRLVQLLDDPKGTGKGRKELMVIYSEDLAPSGKTLAELTTDGKPNGDWPALEQGLVERATSAVSIERSRLRP
jgi:hypothetical protein